jgi:glycosyltransferase involved in cell wall biosynthesis
MKITFLSMNADMTGGSRIIAGHAQRLSARGHRVTIIVKRTSRPIWLQRLRRTRAFNFLASPDMRRPSHFDGLGLDMRFSESADCIAEHDVPDADVVVATWWETAEWAQRFARAKGARAYFIQAHEVFDYLPLERVRATYHAPLHKITVSAWLKREIEREYGDYEVDVALNSVDAAVFNGPDRGRQSQPTVGFVFTPTPWKRVDLILQAITRLLPEFPELQVRAFGGGALPQDFCLSDRTSYIRHPSQQKIADTYKHCDAWVTASVNEGFGLPALEAMACRTPVVATRSGWPADAIRDGLNGYLVEENDIETLVSGLRRVLTIPEELWRLMAYRAQATAHAHSSEQSTDQFEAALLRAVERGL